MRAFFPCLIGAAFIVLAAVLAHGVMTRPAGAQTNEVDVELVLLSDVSSSMSDTERALQRLGYVKALTNPATIEAIQTGALGRIAVTYIEHAEVGNQRVIAHWAVISDEASAAAFAAEIAAAPPHKGTTTAIGAALAFAAAQIDANPFQGLRRIIDISGDSDHNDGPPPAQVRDEVVAKGITINALAVGGTNAVQGFKDTVIGGPGAFVIPARDYRGISKALQRKLRLEIG